MSSTPIVPPSRKSSRFAALIVALAIGLLIVAFFVVRPKGTPGPAMRDFEAFYAAGAVANRGEDPYSRAIWNAERDVPGVDRSHDETLPFVGPPAGLPLWRMLAHFRFDVAGRLWGAPLAGALLVVVFGGLALAGAPRTAAALLGAAILAGSFGPLTSDIALGQIALLSGAGVFAALLLLRSRAWLAASLAATVAALQPNLALVLIARATDVRAWLAFALGAVIFFAAMLPYGGLTGIAHYLQLVAVHGNAERYAVIQISPGAIAAGFGANEGTASMVRGSLAVIALVAVFFAFRRINDPVARVGMAICALPFIVPFFHEHDFLLALLPALICAVRARGVTLALAAVSAVACGIDWLGLGQRPNAELQSVALALASALGFALVAGLRRAAFAGLAVAFVVVAVSPIAHAHPIPIWPDALPPHWQPPEGAGISRVWELEQASAGLTHAEPIWATLRLFSLGSSALLGLMLFATCALDVDVHEIIERRQGVRVEAGHVA